MHKYRITFTCGTDPVTKEHHGHGRNCQKVFRDVMREFPDCDFNSLRGHRIS